MKNIKSLCVYCSHNNVENVFEEAAHVLGKEIAQANLELVYGGGKLGLMGIVADSVLQHGGRAVGFITHYLDKFEGAHTGLQELYFVDTMHTRKLKMSERGDAFVVLPGGFGTLDEFFEIITWKQLMLHDKPIVIVNINNYWSKLIDLMYQVVDRGFALPEHKHIFSVVTSVKDVIPALHAIPDPQQQGFLSHVV